MAVDIVGIIASHAVDSVIGIAVVGGALSMRQVRREIRYNSIRIISMVHALDKESKNGFMNYYKEKRDELLSEHQFMHNKDIND